MRPIKADSARIESLRTLLESVASEGVKDVAEGLSSFVGDKITVTSPKIEVVPLTEISQLAGHPEDLAIGVYLAVTGDFPGHVMLLLNKESAMDLVCLLLGDQFGPVTSLGPLERSALAEIGNLTASLFLNCLARITGYQQIRPSPPAVIEDMAGAILDILAVAIGAVSEYALIMETDFQRAQRTANASFWLIPHFDSLDETVGLA